MKLSSLVSKAIPIAFFIISCCEFANSLRLMDNIFMSALINATIILVIEWVVFKIIFVQRIYIFFKIRKAARKYTFVGFSTRENSESINKLDKESFQRVLKNQNNYCPWSNPIIKIKFSLKWLGMEPKLSYFQKTTTSKSTATSTKILKTQNIYDIRFNFENKILKDGKLKGMKDKDGQVTLFYDSFIEEIMFFSYQRGGNEKTHEGFIIPNKKPQII